MFEYWIPLIWHYFFNLNSKWLLMLHSWRKKIVKWTSNAFLRKVNFIFDVFSRVSFPFKYRKAIFWQSWRLKSQNYPLAVNHVHDTDLSKLGNLCQVKNISLISTPDWTTFSGSMLSSGEALLLNWSIKSFKFSEGFNKSLHCLLLYLVYYYCESYSHTWKSFYYFS